jgi:hypothetical protein
MNTFAAVDLGAASGRVMRAEVTADRLELTEVERFGNVPVRVGGTLHWDALRIFRGVTEGLPARSTRSASTRGPSTTGCSTPTAGCSATRFTTATSAPTGSWSACSPKYQWKIFMRQRDCSFFRSTRSSS